MDTDFEMGNMLKISWYIKKEYFYTLSASTNYFKKINIFDKINLFWKTPFAYQNKISIKLSNSETFEIK